MKIKVTTQALSTIRILGRDPVGSKPLFTKEGIRLLTSIAFDHDNNENIKDTTSSREALKCIANCIHLNDSVKVFLEEQDIIGLCLLLMQSDDHLSLETQFLTCRVLFFMTVNRPDLVSRLIHANISAAIAKVYKVLNQNIELLENPTNLIDKDSPINPLTVTSEALKLLFNLLLVDSRTTRGEEGEVGSSEQNLLPGTFEDCLNPVFRLLFNVPFSEPQPLVPPHSQAIHTLMQYPYETIARVWSKSPWAKQGEACCIPIATTLVELLDRSVHTLIPHGDPDDVNGSEQVDATLSPLLLVLRALAEGDSSLSQYMAKRLLPNEKDRMVPVHEGFGLPAYMIRLMTSTMMPLSRDGACETLFVLCDKDATKLTQKVGYGNAIGFLVNKGIAMEAPSSDDTEKEQVNPITGQYVSSEKQPELKDMTDEEKEREAEKLFVLFERLKKTGIIDVENPIAKAMQESQGRFEEVDSSEDE
ncbi:hypothetical protein INT47_010439 [Mucor saturninus]|uniref:Uncharacterized protein n=1 Tax=Mucor saturninus TaxID=64648 RepID=A0A8H7RD57_9FUNG|nr:hypothetical protein INT47_010439 [Mucor saturninus]